MSQQQKIMAARQSLREAAEVLQKGIAAEKTRRRGDLIRQMHEVRQMLNPTFNYVSQAGQDVVIDGVFGQKTGGTFIDIGGYDGITGSNTYFLEQQRGWTGVLVEPVEDMRLKAKSLRKCPCLGYAVADANGEAEFIAVTKGYRQMSGLAQSYDAKLLETVRADPRHEEKTVKVPTRSIAAILKEAGIKHPDFISLDIEGGELTALRGFPFADHQVGAWAIENNTGTMEIAQIMRAHGYDLIEFCGPDEIYRKVKT